MPLLSEIRQRRVLPALGVYIAGCWVAVEILARLEERYYLSPYLTDIVFWGLFSLIPAVLLLAWSAGAGRAQTLAVRGETVHTLAGKPIADGVVLIETGRRDEAQALYETMAVDDFARLPQSAAWLTHGPQGNKDNARIGACPG